MEWISLKNTNNTGISIINIHYDIASVMFATETYTETDVITPHPTPPSTTTNFGFLGRFGLDIKS